MIEKIRYRLVYNRKKQLNKQGAALVQIEAYLNGRKIYLNICVRMNGTVIPHRSYSILMRMI